MDFVKESQDVFWLREERSWKTVLRQRERVECRLKGRLAAYLGNCLGKKKIRLEVQGS